ncbi:transglycosylase SLT domain-containing protein [Psychromonas ossibalaenae]|uniref:transglycosylase SLT domain-containing protein n=1 Tax=Psychromonas ossibalaenae TaxID=444922 RepID=UPI000370A930|nr:transglycosylase SLT domain-containing protein [Psychromonas ossibalaenae]
MNKILVVCLYFFSISALAVSYSLEQQREIYSQARELQKEQKWSKAQAQAKLISDYPLAYLLDYYHLKASFSKSSLAAVRVYLKQYPNRRISDDLQRDYLYYLAKNEYWNEFLSFYPKLPNTPSLKCSHIKAQIKQGASATIWPAARKVWLSGFSQPNACDEVFEHYKSNKKISAKLIWKRFELAYLNNNKGIMSYLISLMPAEDKTLAKKLYALNKRPDKLLNSPLFKNRQQKSFAFLATSIKRLARKEVSLGLQAFSVYQKNIAFTLREEIQIKRYLASLILSRNEIKHFTWLDAELLSIGDSSLIERRIRYAIKFNNWKDIEHWLTKLPPARKQHQKWVYWQARVLENNKQDVQANMLYQKIAAKRTYYGFLAAQKLGIAYQFNAQLVMDQLQSLSYLQADLAHIEELVFNKHNSLLKREWEALLKRRGGRQQQQLGLYAFQKGWAHLSVLASIRSKSWDALNIRFPEVKPELFLANADKYQLDSTYLYAITRQESSFDEYANSPVGARGYMQLMPQTAKETARKIGLKEYKKKAQLTQGEINVQLGSAYFDMLLKRYEGNRILATAAYNAGPHRVDRWRGKRKGRAEQGLAMDSWIETIPYNETRRYVKNVLAYNVIYQHILDKPLEFFNAKELNARY